MGFIEDVLLFLTWCWEQPIIQVIVILSTFIGVIVTLLKGPRIIRNVHKKYTRFKHERLIRKVKEENIIISKHFRKLGEVDSNE